MTKKFEKAKAGTIQKWSGVLEAVKTAKERETGSCGFCYGYGGGGKICREDCPIAKLCCGKLHKEIRSLLGELEEKIVKGLSLLGRVKDWETVKEKQPRRK